MNSYRLLGHLAHRFSAHPENVTTEALAYILSHSPAAREALYTFVTGLNVSLPRSLAFFTQRVGPDGSIPDLVAQDSAGKEALIVEAKFWAGLTDNQPVAYLKRLPRQYGGVLLFLVPALRLSYLWDELIRRCTVEFDQVSEGQSISEEAKRIEVAGTHTLAIASWRAFLAHVSHQANLAGETETVADVLQLQGVCDRMDEEAFLPLQSEELSSQTGNRLIQYSYLVDEAVTELTNAGIARPWGNTSGGRGSYFRPIKIHEFGAYLEVNAYYWAHKRATPIWLRIRDPDGKSTHAVRDALLPLQNEQPPKVIDAETELFVPIYLSTGVERSEVLTGIVLELKEIAELLRNSFFDPTEPNVMESDV